jgi:hypothetical protein
MKKDAKCEIDVPLDDILTSNQLKAIKDLQEYGNDIIKIIESEQDLLIAKYEFIGESSDQILERLSDLRFVKLKLQDIINV